MSTMEAKIVARSFERVLRRVHSKRECFAIVNGGETWAYLAPADSTHCNSHELADDVASATLSARDRRALATNLRKGRRSLKPLANPWD
ncbi:MAG: hypothetical protein KIS67_18295 [Verrucomicrobiae bacterium]|nr:hypothetical protein [Verrucomicrobiae bacterium]